MYPSWRPSVIQFIRSKLMTQERYAGMSARREAFSATYLKSWDGTHPSVHRPQLYLYGSTLSCTALNDGDVDFALSIADDLRQLSREEQAEMLTHLYSHLVRPSQETSKFPFVNQDFHRIFRARVPVLQHVPAVGHPDTLSFFKFDLTMSLFGVRNSLLLRQYVKDHPIVRPVILLVKHWGHRQAIIDSRNGWLSSYALTLMALEYLHVRRRVPVIPPDSIRIKIPPSAYDEWITFHEDHVPEDIQDVMRGFFEYYAHNFDFDEHIVDVTGAPLRRGPRGCSPKEEFFTQEENERLTDEEKWHRIGHGNIVVRDPYEDHSLGRSVEFFKAEGFRQLLEWSEELCRAGSSFEDFTESRTFLPRSLLRSNRRSGIIS